MVNSDYINKITLGNCLTRIPKIIDNSIDLFLSDIPYGINLDSWDVFHQNTNSALLGQSPAQKEKSGFKRRGKPINGWAQADRNMGLAYQKWCESWVTALYPKMKSGASLFVFGARRTIHRVINAFEDSGFLLKDTLAWKKNVAHHRAQRISLILKRRGLIEDANQWEGWRLGNLAPIWEPIAWFMKPYKMGSTLTDNVLEQGVGAIHITPCNLNNTNPTNLLEFSFRKEEVRYHEAQKPLDLIEYLIKLTTKANQIVLDPFMGSGTTAIACLALKRHFIGFEINAEYHQKSLERLQKIST